LSKTAICSTINQKFEANKPEHQTMHLPCVFFPNHVHKQFNQKSGRFQFYFVSGLPFVAASASRNKQDMPMMTNKHTCLYNLTGSTICGFTVKQNFYRGKKVARARPQNDRSTRP
jgi:hypothetical protein